MNKAPMVAMTFQNHQPLSIAVGVVAARHPGQTEEVHREEGQVEPDEGQPELHLAQALVEHLAGDLRASRSRARP